MMDNKLFELCALIYYCSLVSSSTKKLGSIFNIGLKLDTSAHDDLKKKKKKKKL